MIFLKLLLRRIFDGDFLDGPVVKNLPSKAEDTSLIPGQEAKISHATGQLSLCITTGETPLHTGKPIA